MIKRIAVLSVAAAVVLTFAVAGSAEAAPLSSVGAKVKVNADWGIGVGVNFPGRVYRPAPQYVTYEQRPIYGTVIVGYDVYGNPMYGTGIVGWQTVPVVHHQGWVGHRARPSVSLGLGFSFGGRRHHHHHH